MIKKDEDGPVAEDRSWMKTFGLGVACPEGDFLCCTEDAFDEEDKAIFDFWVFRRKILK